MIASSNACKWTKWPQKFVCACLFEACMYNSFRCADSMSITVWKVDFWLIFFSSFVHIFAMNAKKKIRGKLEQQHDGGTRTPNKSESERPTIYPCNGVTVAYYSIFIFSIEQSLAQNISMLMQRGWKYSAKPRRSQFIDRSTFSLFCFRFFFSPFDIVVVVVVACWHFFRPGYFLCLNLSYFFVCLRTRKRWNKCAHFFSSSFFWFWFCFVFNFSCYCLVAINFQNKSVEIIKVQTYFALIRL